MLLRSLRDTHVLFLRGVTFSVLKRGSWERDMHLFSSIKEACDSCPSVWGVNKKDCFQVIYIHSESLFWMQFSWISQERKNHVPKMWKLHTNTSIFQVNPPYFFFFKLKSILISKKSGGNFFIIENTTPVKHVTFHQISFIDFKYSNVHQDNRNLEVSTTHILPSKFQNVFRKEMWVVK